MKNFNYILIFTFLNIKPTFCICNEATASLSNSSYSTLLIGGTAALILTLPALKLYSFFFDEEKPLRDIPEHSKELTSIAQDLSEKNIEQYEQIQNLSKGLTSITQNLLEEKIEFSPQHEQIQSLSKELTSITHNLVSEKIEFGPHFEYIRNLSEGLTSLVKDLFEKDIELSPQFKEVQGLSEGLTSVTQYLLKKNTELAPQFKEMHSLCQKLTSITQNLLKKNPEFVRYEKIQGLSEGLTSIARDLSEENIEQMEQIQNLSNVALDSIETGIQIEPVLHHDLIQMQMVSTFSETIGTENQLYFIAGSFLILGVSGLFLKWLGHEPIKKVVKK